jgi:conjugal transfer pilus assembly protein TraV|tara:strand:+ start:9512 stop:10123 length:612 start_codon:yes stop_codon:yes gene_type:complete
MAKPLTYSALASAILALSGCASLGGNISGSFDCRAPSGTCAPTSAIDAEATGQEVSLLAAPSGAALTGPTGRMLRVVLAAYRDTEGRMHEARVVHVALAEAASAKYQAPRSAADIGKGIACGIGSNEGQSLRHTKADHEDEAPAANPFPLPDALVSPSPVPMADPGVLPPGPEGSGVIAPLHDRAPQLIRPQSGNIPEAELQP